MNTLQSGNLRKIYTAKMKGSIEGCSSKDLPVAEIAKHVVRNPVSRMQEETYENHYVNNEEEDNQDSAEKWIPQIGQVFESEEDAYSFYNYYAGRMGFGVRKEHEINPTFNSDLHKAKGIKKRTGQNYKNRPRSWNEMQQKKKADSSSHNKKAKAQSMDENEVATLNLSSSLQPAYELNKGVELPQQYSWTSYENPQGYPQQSAWMGYENSQAPSQFSNNAISTSVVSQRPIRQPYTPTQSSTGIQIVTTSMMPKFSKEEDSCWAKNFNISN